MVTVASSGNFTHIGCDSAAEFLDVLNPVNGFFSGPSEWMWVFRGSPSDKYDLIPSAFRPGTELMLSQTYTVAPLKTAVAQCAAEIHTLARFFETAANHGVRLPEDSTILRHSLADWHDLLTFRLPRARLPVVWPPPELYSLIGLAQHYGVPTRALDWTASPWTAAYFATALPSGVTADRLVVWSFSRFHDLLERVVAEPPEQPPLVLFTAPGADNENLRAQRGLFMIAPQELNNRDEPFNPKSYDQLLIESRPTFRNAALYQITAPIAEARVIRAALAAAGITAGFLFPGLWGIARELREERDLKLGVWNLPRTAAAAEVFEQLAKLRA
jgi:hypothetical protein